MGIYVFNRRFLEQVLTAPSAKGQLPTDFGKEVFPTIVRSHHVHAHVFDGFWEDLGTIRSYHEVSLQLCQDDPKFEFHGPEGVVYTRSRALPPSRISTAKLDRVRLADGCVIQRNVEISRCVIGVRSRICEGAKVIDTVMTGADRIESDAERARNSHQGKVDLGVGPGAVIKGAILDKDCRIGAGAVIDNAAGIPFQHEDNEDRLYYIRDGIVVVPRGTTIPAGTRIPSS
jgi:glucose-1-phosphate adenylyltransferase